MGDEMKRIGRPEVCVLVSLLKDGCITGRKGEKKKIISKFLSWKHGVSSIDSLDRKSLVRIIMLCWLGISEMELKGQDR